MADIKTRDAVKGTIKQIDKAAIAADRMRVAYVQTKEKAEHSTHAAENSAEEYAADRYEGGVDRVTHEVAHQFDKQGRKGVEATKENYHKAKDSIRQFKEKEPNKLSIVNGRRFRLRHEKLLIISGRAECELLSSPPRL